MPQLTEGVWNHSKIPNGENRVDVEVQLILDKRHYERFMHLIYNDSQLFAEICSTIMNAHVKGWTGKTWTVGSPEVVCEFISAAQDKHAPLPADDDEESKKEKKEA